MGERFERVSLNHAPLVRAKRKNVAMRRIGRLEGIVRGGLGRWRATFTAPYDCARREESLDAGGMSWPSCHCAVGTWSSCSRMKSPSSTVAVVIGKLARIGAGNDIDG